jgi:hypothetical protein
MKSLLFLSLFTSVFLSSIASAQSGQIYPFQYFEHLPVQFDPGDSRVFPGVRASIQSSELNLDTTNVLYLAPKKAKVAVTSFVREEFAACQEVRNESVLSVELSNIYKDVVATYRAKAAFALELTTDVTNAKRSCKNALIAKSPDAVEICRLSKSLAELEAQEAESMSSTLKELNDLRDAASVRMDEYGNQYGGSAGAIVELWDKSELEEVKQRNPGKVVQIVPMGEIMFDFTADIEKDSALGVATPRRSALGFSLQGQSTTTAQTGGTPQAVTQVKTGESTALLISLSRLGACSEEGLERMGTFVYNYDTYGYIKGEASYNRHEFRKRLKTESTKKGFFTTKTSRKIIDEMTNSQEIKIAAYGDDAVSQAEMERRLKESLEKDILSEIAKRTTVDTLATDMNTPVQSPTAGATVAGDALLKCPDWRCQIGGYVLKTAAEIWGKGTTEDAFEQNWNSTYTNKWSSTTIHAGDGSSSALIKFK